MKTYHVGILGFGFIGKVHAYGHLNIPLFYDPPPCATRITHICTSRSETAERGRAQVGADVATTDYREITENPGVDIVHICTPNH
ncbi:MAG TPA: Gfo/Idh/MocA family oxidoreductase, partial [Candidatus Hydrogenedentes bacterium]|nr:Gfo/Idh/MocA family oxidoreductase [Candidatus Hydrogenedentota bacterium]